MIQSCAKSWKGETMSGYARAEELSTGAARQLNSEGQQSKARLRFHTSHRVP